MLSWIREKFGTVVIGGIISLIAFVFVFYGVFSPKSTRGLHEGSVAGTVNGDPIQISDFNRELNRRLEYFKQMSGGKFTEDQLKAFRIRETIFKELVNRKIMLQEAQKKSLVASDEEVKEKIQEIPAFQKDGKFDVTTYKEVLESNHYTPSSFERSVRDDSSLRQWDSYFRERIQVTDEEIRREYWVTQDRRNLKYILITPEAIKGTLKIADQEVEKYLADPAKLNLAKLRFEADKDSLYKGQKFEAVKAALVRSVLAGEQIGQIQKISGQLGDQVLAELKADTKSDAKVNALLKPYGITVKTSGLLSRQNTGIPGVGEARDLMMDAFSKTAPLDPKTGGKAKKYALADRVLVGLVIDTQKPDFTKMDSMRGSLIGQISMRKTRDLYQDWMKALVARSKVETNPSVVDADGS